MWARKMWRTMHSIRASTIIEFIAKRVLTWRKKKEEERGELGSHASIKLGMKVYAGGGSYMIQ